MKLNMKSVLLSFSEKLTSEGSRLDSMFLLLLRYKEALQEIL